MKQVIVSRSGFDEAGAARTTMMTRLWHKACEEFQELDVRLWTAQALLLPLPPYVGSRVRAEVLRAAGFHIGQGTMFWGMPRICGTGALRRKLAIGQGCWFNVGCFLELGGEIEIGAHISFGPEVMILTSSHDVDQGLPARRAVGVSVGKVTIGQGAWLGARATILPGVTIGGGAIVAAGAVVHEDVPPNTLVGGIPARFIKALT